MPDIETRLFSNYAGGTPNAVVDAVYTPTGGGSPTTIRATLEQVPNKLDAGALTGAAEKAEPVNADAFVILDSAAGGAIKRVTLSGLRAALKAVFDTIYAAASHLHPIANITGLQTALDAKAAASHTQAISTITGLQTALDGKAASSHGHVIGDVSGLQTALNGKASVASLDGKRDLIPGVFDVGSEIYARVSGPLVSIVPGTTTRPGSDLIIEGTTSGGTGQDYAVSGGTWRCLGGQYVSAGNYYSMWRRIA